MDVATEARASALPNFTTVMPSTADARTMTEPPIGTTAFNTSGRVDSARRGETTCVKNKLASQDSPACPPTPNAAT
jgi:hypothetical protein